ncbi:hypothetical protein [Rickettsia endosymbiont of Polydrusus tereticollis]
MTPKIRPINNADQGTRMTPYALQKFEPCNKVKANKLLPILHAHIIIKKH